MGLTGNVAAGKSVVANVWAEAGVPVVRADDLAREVVAPGSQALQAVAERFGSGVLAGDGTLDRAAMRDVVFRDQEARRDLEAILHPEIRVLRDRWVEERRREGATVVASEIPLLFELGMEDAFDVVVLVDAPESVRERRLVEDRGLSAAEARRLIESQGDPAPKRASADHVLDNAGSLEELRESALRLLDRIKQAARVRK